MSMVDNIGLFFANLLPKTKLFSKGLPDSDLQKPVSLETVRQNTIISAATSKSNPTSSVSNIGHTYREDSLSDYQKRLDIFKSFSTIEFATFAYLYMIKRQVKQNGINLYEKETLKAVLKHLADLLSQTPSNTNLNATGKDLINGLVYLINNRNKPEEKEILSKLGLNENINKIDEETNNQNRYDYLIIMNRFNHNAKNGKRFYLECIIDDSIESCRQIQGQLGNLYTDLLSSSVSDLPNNQVDSNKKFIYGLTKQEGWVSPLLAGLGVEGYNPQLEPNKELKETHFVLLFDYIHIGDLKPTMLLVGIKYMLDFINGHSANLDEQGRTATPYPDRPDPTLNNQNQAYKTGEVIKYHRQLNSLYPTPVDINNTNINNTKKVEELDSNNNQESNLIAIPQASSIDNNDIIKSLFINKLSESWVLYITKL